MVCSLVTDLGKIRPVCMSRFYLTRALTALDGGDKIAAGALLREAIDRYLDALCIYHGVTIQKKRDRTPAVMLRALFKAKQFESGTYKWCRESIQVSNKLVKCKPVKSSLVETCIDLMHCLMDDSREIIFPTRDGGAHEHLRSPTGI